MIDTVAAAQAADEGQAVLNGELMPLVRAAKQLGKDPATIHRWRNPGVKLRGRNERVRLKMLRLGGRWHVGRSDLLAFVAALNGDVPSETPEMVAAIAVATDRPERAASGLRQQGEAAGEMLKRLAPAGRRPKGGAA